jgi:DNA-binding beta-propeller fold protein YncE
MRASDAALAIALSLGVFLGSFSGVGGWTGSLRIGVTALAPIGDSPPAGTDYFARNPQLHPPGTFESLTRPALRVVGTVAVGDYPWAVVVDPINGLVYVSNFDSSNISAVDPLSERVVSSIPVGLDVEGMAVDTSTGNIYAGEGGNQIYEVSGASNQVLATIGVPLNDSQPEVYNPFTHQIYILFIAYNDVVALSTETSHAIRVIPVGECPNGETFDPTTVEIYVVNECSKNVSVINGATNGVAGSISNVVPGVVMVFDPNQGDVYVAGNNRTGTNILTCINATTDEVQATIPVPEDVVGMVFVPELGMLYLASRANNSVTEVNTLSNRVAGVFPMQSTLTGIAWDQSVGELFLADAGTNQLVILKPFIPTYNVSFQENGLSPGTNWSVSLNGQTLSAESSTIQFVEPNGSYTFSVRTPLGRPANPPGGQLSVNGLNITTPITFFPLTGSISGNVTPATASVWIDGSSVPVSGSGAFQSSNLSVGIHSVVARESGFLSYSNNVSVQPGNTTSVDLNLSAIANPTTTINSLAWLLIGILALSTASLLLLVVVTRIRR